MVVGTPTRVVLVAFAKWSAVLMWTLVDDDNDIIHVRAILNTKSQADEIKALILALVKRHSELANMSELIIKLEHKT